MNSKEELEKRDQIILSRIKTHYSKKLKRTIDDEEAQVIAQNLLSFSKAIYGIK